MTILTVGAGEEYSTLSAAVAASQNGDVIQVQAGTYTNDFSTISTSITIEGIGGMVNLVATEGPPNEKGILVIGTETSSPTVTLDNIEFSGAAISAVEGGNAAGVRYQAGNLTINDCYFHNNQDGLLANADTSGSITINDSEFADNGTTSGLTHNIYVNEIGTLTVTGSYITAANTGNEVQSRALVNNIEDNRIVDGPTATASYSINLPNGGVDTVSGNIIEQGPHSENPIIIAFGASGSDYAGSSLTISDNTILNDEDIGDARAIYNFSKTAVSFTNNSVYGLTAAEIASGTVAVSGTTYLTTEPVVSTAPPYKTLFPGDTLVIRSGGTVVMSNNLPGITQVELMKPIDLTLNDTPDLLVFGTAADINGSTISNFTAGDQIDLTNLANATAALAEIDVTATSTVLKATDGSHIAWITLDGNFAAGSIQTSADGNGGTDISLLPAVGYDYTLPAAAVSLTLGSEANTVSTTAADLLSGDLITAGTSGDNTLALLGTGTFDLGAPGGLRDFSTITVQEGAGTLVELRSGMAATLNVTGSAGIRIIGALDTGVINLGSGDDTVTPAHGETVNGGSGNDSYVITAATDNAVINGGTGTNTLVVNGGGSVAMGSAIVSIDAVDLTSPTNFTANDTPGLQIAGSTAGGDTILLDAPVESVVSGGPDEHIIASAADAGGEISGLGAGSKLEISSGGTITLNGATGGGAAGPLTIQLDAATNLTLSPMQFITALGSAGNDAITAAATNQTLAGEAGSDTLIGYTGGGDMFQGTAAGLSGDTIGNFLSTDQIDITNLASGSAALTATANGANTAVTVASGGTETSFTLVTSFAQSGFTVASDGATGTLITYG